MPEISVFIMNNFRLLYLLIEYYYFFINAVGAVGAVGAVAQK